MDKLINLLNGLCISDSDERLTVDDLIIGIDSLKISDGDDNIMDGTKNFESELDDIITNISKMEIKDNSIVLESIKGKKLIINFADCGIAFRRVHPFERPTYIESF